MDPTIVGATDRECRAALMALCDEPYIRNKTIALLKKLRGDISHLANNFDALAKTLKRKPEAELVICVRCDEAFDPEDTSEGAADACRFHPGDLDEDNREDQWADNDPEMELDPEEFPECFMWSCCEVNYATSSHAQGCTRGRHRTWRKRGRAGTDDSNEDLQPLKPRLEEPATVAVGPVLSTDEEEEDIDDEDIEEMEEVVGPAPMASENGLDMEIQEDGDIEEIYDDDRIVEVGNGGVIAVVADDDEVGGGEAEEMFDPESLIPSIENGVPMTDTVEEVDGDKLVTASDQAVIEEEPREKAAEAKVKDLKDSGIEPYAAMVQERQIPKVVRRVAEEAQKEPELYGDELESEDDDEIGVY